MMGACPKCNSFRVRHTDHWDMNSRELIWDWHCYNCDHEWSEETNVNYNEIYPAEYFPNEVILTGREEKMPQIKRQDITIKRRAYMKEYYKKHGEHIRKMKNERYAKTHK